ncbi:acyl-CoA dehydrogenase [Microbacterium sp. P07]|uniref:acyl-CoA dehydrogenase n=1 Tax=Microbacterium sp. P07 TaxID=3366952 RepID=UPI0037455B4F
MDDPISAGLPLGLGATGPSPLATSVALTARETPGFGLDVEGTLGWVRATGAAVASAPQTSATWEALAAAAAVDVAGARMLEPHVDALQILTQAAAVTDVDGVRNEVGAGEDATWGVFAAEGSGVSLHARQVGDRWTLSGTKPWCSLAGHLSHSLVTAWTSSNERRLFAVDLRAPGVHARGGPWVSRGLAQVVSAPVDFDDAAAAPVGGNAWYLQRPGFAWGGVGVAAVWWGATLPLVHAVIGAAAHDRADQIAAAAAGEADAAAWVARTVLADAAARVDREAQAGDAAPAVIAHRVRATVADAAERIIAVTDRSLGPGPLTTDESHARRVADLRIYLRQHHGLRDLASLGRKLGASWA